MQDSLDILRTDYSSEDFIEHHGIKGMKWGVRRFQNYDGTLTPLGKKKQRDIDKEAYSNKLFNEAKTKEPKITNAVKASANKLYGLEHKLKTKESIKRKLDKESTEENKSIKDTANNIKDTVRYTTISNNNNFVKDYNDFKSKMSDKGYKEVRCKNNFTAYQEGKVKHKSVQSIFEDKDGFKFEVQFQTPESQKAKDKKTPLYEERRNPRTSRERAEYLESEMTKLMDPVPIPKDISSIKSYDRIKR